jgi:DNA-directed RNA polymerase specialized sigma24 family protein
MSRRGSNRRRGKNCETASQPDRVDENCTKPELWVYRDRTRALLLRYLHMSVEVGRLPSILGQEFFRAHVTSYKVSTFEDAVIFVHDVEKSLELLDNFSQELVARVVLQEYTQEEAASLLGCARKTVGRCLPEALDKLSEIFLTRGMLREWDSTPRRARRPCQAVSCEKVAANDCGGES